MIPSDFHFLRPLWLAALLPLAALAWSLRRSRRTHAAWSALCDAALVPFVIITRPGAGTDRLRRALLASAALAIVAAAGPTWQRLPVPVFRDDSSLVVVLDLSLSMDATDVAPSRLARARYDIADLLRAPPVIQSALVVYARDAFVVTPLTTDAATLLAQLPALSTELMPRQGSAAERGVEKAAELLAQAGVSSGQVLLVTDGVAPDSRAAVRAIAQARELSVSVLGVGTPDGAPIPLRRGGFVRDRAGNMVIARRDDAALGAVASDSGGVYVRAEDAQGIARLASGLAEHLAQAKKVSEPGTENLQADLWRDQGPWLLLPVLPLVALAFRRGVLACVLVCLLPFAGDARADGWQDWFERPDQRALHSLEANRPAEAAARFTTPAWKGVANYRAGHYDAAATAFAAGTDAESQYNLGNALARQGKLDAAIAAYDHVLALDPGHADAQHNREVVAQARAQQQPPASGGQAQQNGADPGQESRAAQSPGGQGQGSQSAQASSSGQSDSDSAPDRERQERTQGEAEAKDQNARPAPDRAAAKPVEDGPGSPSNAADSERPSADPGQPEAAADQRAAHDENREATEQWLRRIPDDPGGLLRRKFLLQYQRAGGPDSEADEPW